MLRPNDVAIWFGAGVLAQHADGAGHTSSGTIEHERGGKSRERSDRGARIGIVRRVLHLQTDQRSVDRVGGHQDRGVVNVKAHRAVGVGHVIDRVVRGIAGAVPELETDATRDRVVHSVMRERALVAGAVRRANQLVRAEGVELDAHARVVHDVERGIARSWRVVEVLHQDADAIGILASDRTDVVDLRVRDVDLRTGAAVRCTKRLIGQGRNRQTVPVGVVGRDAVDIQTWDRAVAARAARNIDLKRRQGAIVFARRSCRQPDCRTAWRRPGESCSRGRLPYSRQYCRCRRGADSAQSRYSCRE